MTFKIAWRNLWRNKRRTLITLASIAFGLLLSITFTTMGAGGWGKTIDQAAKMNAGHVTIEPKGYRETQTLDKTLSEATALRAMAKANESVKNVRIRINGQAMAATAHETLAAFFYGVNPKAEEGKLYILDKLKKGEPLASTTEKKILIGKAMAEQLEIGIKSKIILTMTNKAGDVVSGLVRVKGIFETGIQSVDRNMVILPIDWLRSLLGYGEDEANQIAILLDDNRQTDAVTSAMNEKLTGQPVVAHPWRETMPDIAASIAMDYSANIVMQIIIFILIGAGILNTVLMSVLERFREFGVMLAIGTSPGKLGKLVMMETFLLAVVGIATGFLLSLPIYYYLSAIGLDVSSMMTEQMTVGNVIFDPVMNARMYMTDMAWVLGGVFGLILLAGIYPALIAMRTKPLKALSTI